MHFTSIFTFHIFVYVFVSFYWNLGSSPAQKYELLCMGFRLLIYFTLSTDFEHNSRNWEDVQLNPINKHSSVSSAKYVCQLGALVRVP